MRTETADGKPAVVLIFLLCQDESRHMEEQSGAPRLRCPSGHSGVVYLYPGEQAAQTAVRAGFRRRMRKWPVQEVYIANNRPQL